jgi:hypothetical protein
MFMPKCSVIVHYTIVLYTQQVFAIVAIPNYAEAILQCNRTLMLCLIGDVVRI